jgi:hypothetical protein
MAPVALSFFRPSMTNFELARSALPARAIFQNGRAVRGAVIQTGRFAKSLFLIEDATIADRGGPVGVLRAADQNARAKNEQAPDNDLEGGGKQGRIHIAIANPRDGGEFDGNDSAGDRRGHPEVRDQIG